MNSSTTIGALTPPPALPDGSREILPYDPRTMAAFPKTMAQTFRLAVRQPLEMALCAGMGGVMGIIGGGAGAGVLAAVSSMLGAGHDIVVGAALAGAGTGGISTALFVFRNFLTTCLRDRTRNVLKRVDEMSSVCIDPTSMEAMKAVRMLIEADEENLDRVTLIRLDVVACALLDTIRKAGPDEDMVQAARAKAEHAIRVIMEPVSTADPHRPAIEAERRLDQVCSSIIGRPMTPISAPTARVARILSLAEQALASHPHIVDASGARIDDLIRKHVPLLLTLREEAIRSAPAHALDAVDENFSLAFDGVAASIEEAMASIHDAAMDRLSTQVRFLSARRGDDKLLSSVS